jgi:acyl-CoA thioester hydrolase
MAFRIPLEVRGSELDSFGHVNHAVYLNYLEEGRWDFLRKTGLLDPLQRKGRFLAVVEVSMRYVRECRLGDALEVRTTLLPGALFVRFRQEIRDRETGEKVCTARIATLLLGPDRKPVDFPGEVREKYTEQDGTGD